MRAIIYYYHIALLYEIIELPYSIFITKYSS
nr:MAG TPA: hypothetical protein [Caudoviricetes sp.]